MVVKFSLNLLEQDVRWRFKLHISPKRLLERIQMFRTAIRSCVGISLVRKKAKIEMCSKKKKCALRIEAN